MPLVKLQVSIPLDAGKKDALLKLLSSMVAKEIGKPERYVMVTIEETAIIMSGKTGPAAFADIRSVGGLSDDVNRKISNKVCSLLKEHGGISGERVYINFSDVPASDWGWDGSTFG
jgi:phenylpyruvate tautomerase PptA (4-oxalocrotonate tautomerase family)